MKRLIVDWLLRFAEDRKGLAAIEFAMLAPIMLLLYFGMAESSQAYMANRRANHTASIVADLVAQGETTTKAELNRVFGIGELVMRPFGATPLSIRISIVTLDKNGRAIVDWSRGSGTALPARTKGSQYMDLPSGLILQDQSLIIGETTYTYTSSFTQVIKTPLVFSRQYYLRPRSSEKITCADC